MPLRHINHLIVPGIRRILQIILLRHLGRQEPPAQEMRAPIILHQRLRCRQADQTLRHELLAWPIPRGTILDIPRAGRIDRQYGHLGRLEGGDDGAEGVADLAREAEAEDGVDDVVGGGGGGGEVVGEGDLEVLELGGEAGVDFLVGGDGVEYGGGVAIVEEVAGCYEAISACFGRL